MQIQMSRGVKPDLRGVGGFTWQRCFRDLVHDAWCLSYCHDGHRSRSVSLPRPIVRADLMSCCVRAIRLFIREEALAKWELVWYAIAVTVASILQRSCFVCVVPPEQHARTIWNGDDTGIILIEMHEMSEHTKYIFPVCNIKARIHRSYFDSDRRFRTMRNRSCLNPKKCRSYI